MKTVIKIDGNKPGVVSVNHKNDNGEEISKQISYKDLLEIFRVISEEQSFTDERKWFFNPPLLLQGVGEERVDNLICGVEKTGCFMRAVFFMPAHRNVINYWGEKNIIPYPSLLFYFEAKKGNVIDTRIFAMKEEKAENISSDSTLYCFPFGNVAAGNGRCCWGSCRLPKIKSYKSFLEIFPIFFGSEVNDDYYSSGSHVIAKEEFKLQIGLIKNVGKKEKFPAEFLVKSPMKNFSYIEKLLNSI